MLGGDRAGANGIINSLVWLRRPCILDKGGGQNVDGICRGGGGREGGTGGEAGGYSAGAGEGMPAE